MGFKKLRIIRPKNEKDLEELRRLDEAGKLVHGDSYPTAEQFARAERHQRNKKRKLC